MSQTTTARAQGNGLLQQQVGLFIGSWEAGLGMLGSARLTLDLTFNAPRHTVSGYGHVSQPVSPPLEIDSQLTGDYTIVTIMDEPHVVINMTGYPVGPSIMEPNMVVHMVLDGGWQAGTCTFKYRSPGGEWHEVEDAPVKERRLPVQAGR